MKITKRVNKANTTPQKGREIKYIVIHYTATTSSKGKAEAIAKYFSSPLAKASADFIVDDDFIVQYNPDIKNRYCWSVGGSRYSTKSCSVAGTLYNKATNSNCINIELCSNKRSLATLLPTDKDWYFTEKTIDNALELTKSLMKQYHIDLDHVIMHNHVTGKLCPAMWSRSEQSLDGWFEFKQRLKYPIKYSIIKDGYLRSSAGGSKVAYRDLSRTMKKKCENVNDYAKLKAGVDVTAEDGAKLNGNKWIKLKCGYWFAIRRDGVVKAEKIR